MACAKALGLDSAGPSEEQERDASRGDSGPTKL